MPELPEVEVLVQHLRPRLEGRVISQCELLRPRAMGKPGSPKAVERLQGLRVQRIHRRGKYILFTLSGKVGGKSEPFWLHLGMTGRLLLLPNGLPLPSHTVLRWSLEEEAMVFVDPRGFGRCGFGTQLLQQLGPEPLERGFGAATLARAFRSSRQSLKQRLLDQSVVAGLGNIYSAEALWQACLNPFRPAKDLTPAEHARLARAIRSVLRQAIRFGQSLNLDWSGRSHDRLFYFGQIPGAARQPVERFSVYDREGLPCRRCTTAIRRAVQGGRSTYYCPNCQT
ncbi:MAG: bifunctional DNA-formamidopyrimidine glycosylase/DNA-(apurinic or apyrimidinic site) lyase [Verrucomicrobiota bacterium]|nr:bifunctional DNA-formamidopyrimidine glycosylase/DNA-(apurinic or apyrimidinic site) lyase [Limisphaera sp.]MDW8381531.1 bifunctional DNA-formamidopyrimidine glycosylase/DNA-(apurinic or apyrimidinic site) lyase [Verrucomicrobiota bacterium]